MTEVHSRSADATLRPHGETDLGAKVASRICHDLANPLGAIANGLELLLMTGLEPTPELSLLQDSVASASARISWFRLAFGPAWPQRVGRAEVTDILRAISRGTRLSYDWTVQGDAPRGEVKAVFLLLQCLEAALPLGGRLTISRSDDAWQVTAQSPRLRFDPSLWASLTSPEVPSPDTRAGSVRPPASGAGGTGAGASGRSWDRSDPGPVLNEGACCDPRSTRSSESARRKEPRTGSRPAPGRLHDGTDPRDRGGNDLSSPQAVSGASRIPQHDPSRHPEAHHRSLRLRREGP